MSTIDLSYSFESKWYNHSDGTLHYIDIGNGEPLLFVHGTPTWSFLWRNQIKELSKHYRCIAIDHLGFGYSEKHEKAPYLPQDHAKRLSDFIDHLGLERFTLAVHDFGGPIGLSYALQHPEKVSRLILCNTWMWSLNDDPAKARIGKLVQGVLGTILYRYLNFSPKVLLKAAFNNKKLLTKELHQQYLLPFKELKNRTAPLVLARNLLSDWYESLWDKRNRIKDIPTLCVWGMKDIAFDGKALERWEHLFTNRSVLKLDTVGHFPQEEAAQTTTQEIERFLSQTPLRE